MENASISSMHPFLFFFNELTPSNLSKQPQLYLKNQKIEIKFVLKMLFYTVFVNKQQKLHLFTSSHLEMFCK